MADIKDYDGMNRAYFLDKVGKDSNQRLPKMTPLMVMHTRRAMQRRQTK